MFEKIKNLKKEIESFCIENINDLDEFNKNFISRKGKITELFIEIGKKSLDEKKLLGREINELKALAQKKFTEVKEILDVKKKLKESSYHVDLTLPVNPRLGGRHPISRTIEKIIGIMTNMGFSYVEGSEIEDDWHNFTALNIPEDHPARDMQDTFYVSNLLALRSQTSTSQIHVMENSKPPLKILSCGKCYRKEDISSRSHCFFHQIEALYVDENISFADLKNYVSSFIKKLFGEKHEVRLRASYFPFTEPSAEVDMSCFCNKKGCRLCKYSGWVEIGGSGMVDPNVLKNCNIDPEIYTGFAWGLGIERIAMLIHNVNDIRLFSENDLKFLKMFRAL